MLNSLKLYRRGKSIIYMCFSSTLSGSYNSALLAREMLEEFPDAVISIIDIAVHLWDKGFGAYALNFRDRAGTISKSLNGEIIN